MAEALASILNSTDKILVVIGIVALIIAVLAPERIPWIGPLMWTRWKRIGLSVLGAGVGSIGLIISTHQTVPVDVDSAPTYYGYYGDLDKDGKPIIEKEVLTLTFENNSPVIRGTSRGEVSTDNKPISRAWTLQGYHVGDNVSLVFTTDADKENPTPSGIGAYILAKYSDAYTGVVVHWDSNASSFLECPYALSTENMDISQAKNRWSALSKRQCVKVDTTPDRGASSRL